MSNTTKKNGVEPKDELDEFLKKGVKATKAIDKLLPDLPRKIEDLLIGQVYPSPTNARSHVDLWDARMNELLKSVKEHGVLQPIMVRERVDGYGKYEIIYGWRRYECSKKAGKDTIPAQICNVDDELMEEYGLLENLMRKDISLLEEAYAFQKMAKKHNIAYVVAKTNKDAKYISQRMKLNDLVEEGKAHVSSELLPLGHAILISALEPSDQDRCLSFLITKDYGSEKVYCSHTLAQLHTFIKSTLTRDMKDAPFNTMDATLVPAAGSCAACPKRTINAKLLFAEMTDEDRCTDGKCYTTKVTAHIEAVKEEVKEEFGKVATATNGWNSGEVKVGGKSLKYTDKPGKGTTPVVITKTENAYAPETIGKVVHVVIPPKEVKAAVEKKAPQEDWKVKDKREYTTVKFPQIQKAAEYIGNPKRPFGALLTILLQEYLENINDEILRPLLLLYHKKEATAETCYDKNFAKDEMKGLLKGIPFDDLLEIFLIGDAIEENGRIEWKDIEAAAPKKSPAKAFVESRKAASTKKVVPVKKSDPKKKK